HNSTQIQVISNESDKGERIDKVLTKHLQGYSRSTIQQWLKSGHVICNGKKPKPRDAVTLGDIIDITVPEVEALAHLPQALELDIVYEDGAILVINKPAGLVVHPGAGNRDQTLLNGLLHYDSKLELIARGGIVHRLDKDTSGLMVVARTEIARQHLVEQLSDRSVKRHYIAIVYGTLVAGGTVEAPIGRHPKDRVKMAVVGSGKPAITHYRIGAKYRHTTKLDVSLETGRTHQIRVHMSSIRLPLVGDPVYGKRMHIPSSASEELKLTLQNFKRQALHATQLGLIHPTTGEALSWQVEMPQDMIDLQSALQNDV
ncbi:MAG: 23S rRNA pseudouridine1911/1915/1917 synthase, partial [Gammaproteobacteria bacterium]